MTKGSRGPANVAVIAYTEYPYDTRVRFESECLAQAGYQVHVICTQSGPDTPTSQLRGVEIHEAPVVIRRGGRLRYLYQYLFFFTMSTVMLLRLHRRYRFHVVHVHTLPDFQVFCATYLKMSGVPIILDMHEAMPEILAARFELSRHSLLYRLAAAVEIVSGAFASRVIVANDGIKSALVSRGMPPDRMTTVYNVGDNVESPVSAEELRQELALPDGRMIVHAGGINPERDLETVIGAISALRRETDAYLIIAGHGDPSYVQSLRTLAAHCGLSDRVIFVGRLTPDRARALMSLSVVGLVSAVRNPLTEVAWPTRIVEFASLRKPLVVPRLRFVSAMLGDGARYYEPGDKHDLSKQLGAVLSAAPADQARISLAESICGRFGANQMREALLELYGDVREAEASARGSRRGSRTL